MNSFVMIVIFTVAWHVGKIMKIDFFDLPEAMEALVILAAMLAVAQDVFKLRYHMKLVEMAERELNKGIEPEDEQIQPPSNVRPA